MTSPRGFLAVAATLLALGGQAAAAREVPAAPAAVAPRPGLLIEPVAEKTVEALPHEPLYWRVDQFSTLAAAQRAAGPLSLPAQAWGHFWLFTLGPAGGSTPGARKIAEVGPVQIPTAGRYLLRINRSGGPPGASTPVQAHPGSETVYVLRGQLSHKTAHGVVRLDAGGALNGREAGLAIQLSSTGAVDLEQLVMFVVDADKPFSTPGSFE